MSTANLTANIAVQLNSRIKREMLRLNLQQIAKKIHKRRYKSIRQKCYNPLFVLDLYRELKKARKVQHLPELLKSARELLEEKKKKVDKQIGMQFQNAKIQAFIFLIHELSQEIPPNTRKIITIIGSGIYSLRKGKLTEKKVKEINECLLEGELPSQI